MKRAEIEFEYAVEDLFAMASARWAYHDSRALHWSRQVAAAKIDLRNNGIEFCDVEDLRPSVTNMRSALATIDERKVRVLHDAQEKLRQHETTREIYAHWLAVLKHEPQSNRMVSLHFDDVVFFLPPIVREAE